MVYKHSDGFAMNVINPLLKKTTKLALTNNMWIGKVLYELWVLTIPEPLLITWYYPHCFIFKLYLKDPDHYLPPDNLQCRMTGNYCLYKLNTPMNMDVLEGHLMPNVSASLASILAITFIRTKSFPKISWKWCFVCIDEWYMSPDLASKEQ